MPEPPNKTLPLRLVDGLALPEPLRRVHRPDEEVEVEDGGRMRLPRYFYEVPSWQVAVETDLTEHFALYEFVSVDVREAAAARAWPRYVPCAVTLLAAHLEVLREALGERVLIAANGAYRSPAHGVDQGRPLSPHHWGAAVDLYRIGDTYLEGEAALDRLRDRIQALMPSAWLRPYGEDAGASDDHLHLDLGYVLATPRGALDLTSDAAWGR
jgi:hypothetical protein